MLDEAREGPSVVERLLDADDEAYAALGGDLRTRPPQAVLTIARGSSDHAAHFVAYLVMARLGRLVTSLPMSLVTLYQSRLACEGLVSLAFSQSGRSHDLVEPTQFFRAGGARTVAFVNDPASPLARVAQWAFDIHAGAETSIAATKSFIAQLVAGARFVAAWQGNEQLMQALRSLPVALRRAVRQEWSSAIESFADADRLFVVSRGLGLPIAMEAALKFKELCGIQAEAVSGAELRHGPMALVDEGYPLLIFALRGPAQTELLALAEEMRGRGARVLVAAPGGISADLELEISEADDLDPIVAIQSFYPMVEALARARGRDPDSPRHLAKITVTR